MKKLKKLILLAVFFSLCFTVTGQTNNSGSSKTRVKKAQEIEKDISVFISENLKKYTLTPERKQTILRSVQKSEKVHNHEHEIDIETVFLNVKKQELRELYLKQNPEYNSFFTLPDSIGRGVRMPKWRI